MKSILSVSVLISFALLLGRVSGFFREMLLAARFGASETADAAILILTLPDFLVGLLLVGGFNAALVPELKQRHGADRQALLLRVALGAVAAFGIVALTFYLFPNLIIGLLAPQMDVAQFPHFTRAFHVSLLALPLAALIGISTSYLNTVGRFTLPSFSVLVFNTLLCVYLLLPIAPDRVLLGFSFAILIATSCRLAFQLLGMKDIFTRPNFTLLRQPTKLIKRFAAGILAYSVIVGVAILFRSLHATNGDGFLAVFNYAEKLFWLPAALMIAPLVTISLPLLSNLTTNKNEYEKTAVIGLQAAWALGFMALALGYSFMPLLVKLAYQRGSLLADDVAAITAVARVMVLCLPAYAILQLSAAALNAAKRPQTVMINAFMSLGLSVAGYLLLKLAFSTPLAAPWGFVIFHIIAAYLNFRALGFSASGKSSLTSTMIKTTLRIGLCIAPFAVLLAQGVLLSLWENLALLIIATAISALLIVPNLRPLRHMKISTA